MVQRNESEWRSLIAGQTASGQPQSPHQSARRDSCNLRYKLFGVPQRAEREPGRWHGSRQRQWAGTTRLSQTGIYELNQCKKAGAGRGIHEGMSGWIDSSQNARAGSPGHGRQIAGQPQQGLTCQPGKGSCFNPGGGKAKISGAVQLP